MNLDNASPLELMQYYSYIMDKLKKSKVVRTRNNPVADYAEWLVAQRMELKLEGNSKAGYDAVSKDGIRIQIKCRRIHSDNSSRQLGVIRKLELMEFDFLIGIIFSNDFMVQEAYQIPHSIISEYARFSDHQNGHIIRLQGDILNDPLTVNITSLLITK